MSTIKHRALVGERNQKIKKNKNKEKKRTIFVKEDIHHRERPSKLQEIDRERERKREKQQQKSSIAVVRQTH